MQIVRHLPQLLCSTEGYIRITNIGRSRSRKLYRFLNKYDLIKWHRVQWDHTFGDRDDHTDKIGDDLNSAQPENHEECPFTPIAECVGAKSCEYCRSRRFVIDA